MFVISVNPFMDTRKHLELGSPPSIALLEVNLTQSKANYSMFTYHRGSWLTVLLVYVIDIVITGDDDLIANLLKSFMARYFHIKDLGPLKYFFGN